MPVSCAMATVEQTAPAPAAAPDVDFDKAQFRQWVGVKALRVPARRFHHYMKLLSP